MANEADRNTNGGPPNSQLERQTEPEHREVNGSELLDELGGAIRRISIIRPEEIDAIALWILHTRWLDAADHATQLALLSPEKRCGKSNLLKLLRALVRNPCLVVHVTPAGLFTLIDEEHVTLLADEGDTFLNGNTPLRGLLDAAFDRGNTVRRKGRSYEVFCNVAYGAIGSLPDTLTDRSIVVEMKRKLKSEGTERITRQMLAELEPVHERCAWWAHDHLEALEEIPEPQLPAELDNRAEDAWRPLLTIAEYIGGAWAARAREVAVMVSRLRDQDDQSQGTMLLRDIRTVFDDEQKRHWLESKTICSRLAAREDRH